MPPDIEAHVARIGRDGYTILEDAIEPAFIDAVHADVARLERELAITPSGNEFEGTQTLRIYNLLVHGTLWERIPVHEHVLPIVERVLDPGCLVSSLSSIAIGPGETPQPIHADDQLIPIPKPHPPIVCNTMWALTDFTEANGATRIIPGTHLRDHSPIYGQHYDSIPAEMQRGSVLVWHGSLWHGGGANRTDAAPHRHRDELLRRLHPPAGEPAARHSAPGRGPLRTAPAGAGAATASTRASSGTSTRRARSRCCAMPRPAAWYGTFDSDPLTRCDGDAVSGTVRTTRPLWHCSIDCCPRGGTVTRKCAPLPCASWARTRATFSHRSHGVTATRGSAASRSRNSTTPSACWRSAAPTRTRSCERSPPHRPKTYSSNARSRTSRRRTAHARWRAWPDRAIG